MYNSVLNSIIDSVDSRCNRLGIDLSSKVNLSKYYNCTEWYRVLAFCTKLDKRIDYFISNDNLKRSKEQNEFMRLLSGDTAEYVKWLTNYIHDTYGTGTELYVSVICTIDDNNKSKVQKAKYYEDIIVTKKYWYSDNTILHEYIVGRLIDDLMDQSRINGFVRTIGYRDDLIYLEYIEYSVGLNRIISKLSREQIESCILQILFNIYYAYCIVGFIHRDLSMYNVMVRKYNKTTVRIPLMIPNADGTFTRRYLRTDVEVKIIDLGHSSINLPNRQNLRLVSYMSPHQAYEYADDDITGISPANDIMYFISTMMIWGTSKIMSKGLMPGIIRMIYMLYTGTVLDTPDHKYLHKFLPNVLRCNPNLHMTSPLLGPLYVREAILQYYSDCIIDIEGLEHNCI